ncbi:hypothetical protein ACP70R_005326 [Stipagrostis hirtigluma subsp. patula]
MIRAAHLVFSFADGWLSLVNAGGRSGFVGAFSTTSNGHGKTQIPMAVDLAVARQAGSTPHTAAGVGLLVARVSSLAGPHGLRPRHARQHAVGGGLRGCVVKHTARVMEPRDGGSVLCTRMLGGIAPLPYSVSKATVVSVVHLAVDQPDPVAQDDAPRRRRRAAEALVEVGMSKFRGAVLELEDVARAAVYLASDEANFLTGLNLIVDGGFTVRKRIGMPVAS